MSSSNKTARLPSFLIVGAMKAGTTTLYRDLYEHESVYLPEIKEPEHLIRPDLQTPTVQADYAGLFKRARPGQICGEASTAYTKRPQYEGVAERARQLLGSKLRIIYMVREPVARIKSQHHFEASRKQVHPDINQALAESPHLVDYSRYAWQIRPWIEVFGRENILILKFEHYVRQRLETVRQIAVFLGIDPALAKVASGEIFNPGKGNPVMSGRWQKLTASRAYRHIRNVIPWQVRQTAAGILLPKAAAPSNELSDESLQNIYSALAGDIAEFESLVLPKTTSLWPEFTELADRFTVSTEKNPLA